MAPGASFVRTNRLSVRSVRGQPGVGGGGGSLGPSGLKAPDREAGGRRDAAGCDRVQTWSGTARAAHSACAIIDTFLIVIFTTTIIIVVVIILTWDGKCSDRNTARFSLVSVNFGVELCGCRRLVVFSTRFISCPVCMLRVVVFLKTYVRAMFKSKT